MYDSNVKAPLLVGCCNKINHIAFDGCNYFCTLSCKCEIIKLNACYECQTIYHTCRQYDCICYDWCEHCFWASSKDCTTVLFKLDCSMNEIDLVYIKNVACSGYITGLSYNCCNDTIIVSFTSSVVSVNKDCGETERLYFSKTDWIMGVGKLCGFYCLIVLRENQYSFEVFNHCFQKLHCYTVCAENLPVNFIFNPCKYFSEKPRIEVFMLKNCQYPYIYEIVLPEEYKDIQCNNCNNFCKKCCCDHVPCGCGSHCDIVESIAMVETAISHILNAEGEKIQKVLSETDDIDQILCVNDHVNQTIIHVTHLEQILYDKLIASSNCEKESTCQTCPDPCK